MDDALRLIGALAPGLGSTGAILVGGFLYFWSRRPADKDKDEQLRAVLVYKDLLEAERRAKAAEVDRRLLAEQRTDQFAHERHEAYQQLWEIKGQFRLVQEQLAAALKELELMSAQLKAMKDQLNAKH